MATAAKNKLLSRISKMLPSTPIGPPLPKRELVKLLKRVRDVLDQAIEALEKDDRPASRPAPRRRKAASRK